MSVSMIHDIITIIHNLMLSQMLEWCSSYRTMALTMWFCLIVIFYMFFLLLLKSWKLYKSKQECKILWNICSTIESNDVVQSINLINKYPHYINRFTENGYTPFLIACAHGNTQLVKLMLKKGADVKLKSLKSESAFYLASFYYIKYPHLKNATCIWELYYAGADINEANGKCLTPLQMAAMFGHTPLVKWLLMKNAATNIAPDPYVIARSQGHEETAKMIWKLTMSFTLDYKMNNKKQ